MINVESLSPTHSNVMVAVGGYGIDFIGNTPSRFAVRVALDKTTDTMLVKIPYNRNVLPQIQLLKKAVMSSPVFVCGVVFENLQIHHYEYTDPKTQTVRRGYTATATAIKEIIS